MLFVYFLSSIQREYNVVLIFTYSKAKAGVLVSLVAGLYPKGIHMPYKYENSQETK